MIGDKNTFPSVAPKPPSNGVKSGLINISGL